MREERNELNALRAAAEARLASGPEEETPVHPAEEILHELHVHQIELEMQNDELRRAQIALEESRDRYLDLYDFAPVGYLTLTREGLISEINLTGATLVGVERRKLIQRRFAQFVAVEDRDHWHQLFLHMMQLGENQSCELALQRRDGTMFHACLNCLKVEGGASPVLRIALTDITDCKQAEEALIAAKDEAERANRAKSKFLSSMSHELRTPLNAVLGFGQLLEMDATLNAQQHDEVSEIIKAGRHLLEMVTEVLDLSRVESGNIQLSIEPVNFGELAGMCLTLIQPLAQKRDIRLEHDHVAEVVVRADSTRLKQILINLLSNAVKYNRDGGQIRLHTAPAQGDAVRIMVTDSGFGISPARLPELFQPFNRLGAEGGTIEGTGIGLTICKRMVELMGGRIGVESEAGVGSTFWAELPLDTSPSHAVPEGIAPIIPGGKDTV